MSIKRFREFTESNDEHNELHESSLLNKGFALSQTARHGNNAQKMISSLANVKSLCQRGKSESDLSKKNDIVLDAISELSRALTYSATMSSANINVTAAATVLSHDVKKEIQNALTKKRR